MNYLVNGIGTTREPIGEKNWISILTLSPKLMPPESNCWSVKKETIKMLEYTYMFLKMTLKLRSFLSMTQNSEPTVEKTGIFDSMKYNYDGKIP